MFGDNLRSISNLIMRGLFLKLWSANLSVEGQHEILKLKGVLGKETA